MDTVQDITYRDLYGRLTAFIQKFYESAQQTESSIRRELHHVETSRSEVAQKKRPQLESLLREREIVVLILELILRKTLKEERISKLPEEHRDFFEGIFGSPEWQKYANS